MKMIHIYSAYFLIFCQSTLTMNIPPLGKKAQLQQTLFIRKIREWSAIKAHPLIPKLPALITLPEASHTENHIYPGTFRHRTFLNVQKLAIAGKFLALEPKTFCGLENLRELALARCGIGIIYPDAFSNLMSLKHLDLSGNRLYEFNVQRLALLKNLKSIDLSYNPIKEKHIKKIVVTLKKKNIKLIYETTIANKRHRELAAKRTSW